MPWFRFLEYVLVATVVVSGSCVVGVELVAVVVVVVVLVVVVWQS